MGDGNTSSDPAGHDSWRDTEPYRWPRKGGHGGEEEKFEAKWTGQCHCGAVEYELSRERPLASKYCHCGDCKVLHGAPFQWAAIFHKSDMRFTRGLDALGFYHTPSRAAEHVLPCKVYCARCRTPVMDEGRRMLLLFPTLIRGLDREAFAPTCHLFYPQRVVDFAGDGRDKWEGLDGNSAKLDDQGKRV